MEESLYDHIVTLTGVSRMIGDGVVRRALEDVGVEPTEASREDFERALDAIEARLLTFLSKQEARERVTAIRVGLRRSEFPGARGSVVPGQGTPSRAPRPRRDDMGMRVDSGFHALPPDKPSDPSREE